MKQILLGVAGGIAAYKSCEVARLLIRAGHSVQVMMTKAAREFVTAMTFKTLTGKPVATDLFSLTEESQIGHITLADWADLVLIAPATADVMARAAHGLADDLVTTVLLATRAPIVFAAAMNVNMYQNPLTQKNIRILKEAGHQIIPPEPGELACGWEGQGRLAAPEHIVKKVLSLLN